VKPLTTFQAVVLPILLTVGSVGSMSVAVYRDMNGMSHLPFVALAAAFSIVFFACKRKFQA